MIADGNCDLTNELGLTMDGSGFGLVIDAKDLR
jgi:peroxiredoxin